jgi:hypothetical protein
MDRHTSKMAKIMVLGIKMGEWPLYIGNEE